MSCSADFYAELCSIYVNDRATCSVQGHSGLALEFSEVYKYLRKAVFHVL